MRCDDEWVKEKCQRRRRKKGNYVKGEERIRQEKKEKERESERE